MMAYPLIELCEELKDRIQKAKDNGGLECKDIFIGDFEQIRKLNDYPITVIAPLSSNVDPECMKWEAVDDATIGIVYIISKRSDNNNKLYKDGDTTGALGQLGILLNYIEKKTSDGSVDVSINAKTNSMFRHSIRFDYSNSDLVKIFITMRCKTRSYQRGQR